VQLLHRLSTLVDKPVTCKKCRPRDARGGPRQTLMMRHESSVGSKDNRHVSCSRDFWVSTSKLFRRNISVLYPLQWQVIMTAALWDRAILALRRAQMTRRWVSKDPREGSVPQVRSGSVKGAAKRRMRWTLVGAGRRGKSNSVLR